MTRKVVITWAAADTTAALHAQYRAEREPEVRTRLHALWLLRQGEPPAAVAAAVGVGLRSVHRWLQWYREGGLAQVRSRAQGRSGQALLPDAGAGAAGGGGGGPGGVRERAGGAGLD